MTLFKVGGFPFVALTVVQSGDEVSRDTVLRNNVHARHTEEDVSNTVIMDCPPAPPALPDPLPPPPVPSEDVVLYAD